MIGTLKFVDSVSISSDGAAEREGGVEAALAVTGDRHPQVARERDDEARLRRGIDVDDHHHVGALAADLVGRAERLLLLVGLHEGPRVGADDQEVRGLRPSPAAPAGRRGCAWSGSARTASSKNRLPVETPIAVATSTRTSAIGEATKEVLERGARSHDGPHRTGGSAAARPQLSAHSHASYSTGRPRSRAMISRWISLVPSPISRIFASR